MKHSGIATVGLAVNLSMTAASFTEAADDVQPSKQVPGISLSGEPARETE